MLKTKKKSGRPRKVKLVFNPAQVRLIVSVLKKNFKHAHIVLEEANPLTVKEFIGDVRKSLKTLEVK